MVLLRELQDLVGLHLLRFSHINVENEGTEKQVVASVSDRQDLHPEAGEQAHQLDVSVRVL